MVLYGYNMTFYLPAPVMDPGFVERGGEGQKVGSLQLVLLIKKNPQKGSLFLAKSTSELL